MNSPFPYLVFGGASALLGVLIHVAAIVGGERWYEFFRAPPTVVESARQGTWLAPLSTSFIALAMALCATYAFSGAGLLPKVPLLKLGLVGIGAICLLRGAMLIPLWALRPQLVTPFEVWNSAIWFATGCGYAAGWYLLSRTAA